MSMHSKWHCWKSFNDMKQCEPVFEWKMATFSKWFWKKSMCRWKLWMVV